MLAVDQMDLYTGKQTKTLKKGVENETNRET
jgi:hypothetical protein